MNLLGFMVNNAPKWRWQGISKHNVLNLAVTIQQSTDRRVKFTRKNDVVKTWYRLLQRTKFYDYGNVTNRPQSFFLLFYIIMDIYAKHLMVWRSDYDIFFQPDWNPGGILFNHRHLPITEIGTL